DIFVLERIMMLCKWHSTRIEPYVDQVGYPSHRATIWCIPRDIIDPRTMQIKFCILSQASFLFEFSYATDTLHIFRISIAHPNWKRSAPVTLTRNSPIDIIL